MTALSNLSETAEAILAQCITALGARVPARQYIATGQVSYDGCDQISVVWSPTGLFVTDPFPSRSTKPIRCVAVIAAEFLVECTRCVPVIQGDTFPEPADISAAHEEIMADGETLFCSLLAAAQAGTLFGTCRLFTFGAMTPYGPSGAVGAVRIPITVQMTCATADV